MASGDDRMRSTNRQWRVTGHRNRSDNDSDGSAQYRLSLDGSLSIGEVAYCTW